MAGNQIDMEAFGMLLKVIGDYREKLDTNKRILVEAANVCDQAMGSDPIIQKKIAKLESALTTLDYTCMAVEEAAGEVAKRYAQAEEIIEEA